MQVLFDLQEALENMPVDDITGNDFIVPVGDLPPKLTVCQVEDVRTILVKERPDKTAGLGVRLNFLPQLRPGDRITITGRVAREFPAGSWGVALCTEETETRLAEECQLAHFTSPRSIFSLSHILCAGDLNGLLNVHTTRWGSLDPTMDFYIDGILILRDGDKYSVITEDPREFVYSLEIDQNLKPEAYDGDDTGTPFVSNFLEQSGNPEINVFLRENLKAMYIGSRSKDWDGVDINMKNLALMTGNKYEVTVMGKADGFAPDGSVITLQGIPGYSWRNNQTMASNGEFTLRHTFSPAELDHWTTLRITTNATGAAVPFYLYSIEIKRLGLL